MNLIIANVGNEAWSVRGHELIAKAVDLTSRYNATRDDLLKANPTFPVQATPLPTFQLNIFLRQALKAIRAKIKESLDEVEREVARGDVHKAKELLDKVTEMWRDVDRVAGYIRAQYPEEVPALDEDNAPSPPYTQWIMEHTLVFSTHISGPLPSPAQGDLQGMTGYNDLDRYRSAWISATRQKTAQLRHHTIPGNWGSSGKRGFKTPAGSQFAPAELRLDPGTDELEHPLHAPYNHESTECMHTDFPRSQFVPTSSD
ncbi:hypothetical protein BKA70DRAFT_1218497 [Coprinopsis sp. MPI-PUGE-AT-0042]|nr:hypothetical protein BKA70DRAFT_1218497 [Coprinopsis sp. MPI-PUGE-AT-0042]